MGLAPEASADSPGEILRAIVAYDTFDDVPEDGHFGMLGLEVLYRFVSIPAVALNGTQTDIESLRTDPSLDYIEYDEELDYFMNTAVFSTNVVDVWNEAWWPSDVDRKDVSPLMVDKDGDGTPDKAIDGDGVTIGIVDSGINALHPDLWYAPAHVDAMPWEPKVLECTSVSAIFDPQVPNPYCDPTVGHGTHVAGIAGGTGWAARNGLSPTKSASAPPMGAAPGASLVGAGLGAGIFIVDSTIALDWMFANVERYGIKVINNSWGGTANCPNSFPGGTAINVTNRLIEEKDVVVVWAASNYDNSGATWTSPQSRNPTPGSISVANYHDLQTGSRNGAVSTGSSDGCVQPQSAGDYIWTFPDLAAPGTGIVAPRSYTGSLNVVELPIFVNQDFGDVAWYVSYGGTSMAAPHVAGIVALMREANPELTAPEIEQILVRTVTPWSDTVASRGQAGTNVWWGATNSASQEFVDPDSCKITPADAAKANDGDTSVNAKFPRFTDLVARGHDANDFVCRDYRRGNGLVDAHAAVKMALEMNNTGTPGVKIASPADGLQVDRTELPVSGIVDRDAGDGPAASLSADTTQGEPPLTVDFDAGATSSGSPLASWSFDAGDGFDPQSGDWPPPAPITHTYTTEDTYTAAFTATDEDGLADTATVEVTVSSGASEERTLWLVGDGSTTVGTSPAPTNYGLSPDGHGDQETTYIAAFGNNEVAENPFMPTFIGDDPVTLTGEKVTLTAFVNYAGIINELGDICPIDAALFDRSGNPIAPRAQAFVRPGLGSTEIQFPFTPTAGSYSGLIVQIGASGADCGRFPQEWKWGTDEFPARLTLADQDTGGGPGPASAPFATDKTGDSLTPWTDILTVDTEADDQDVEIKIQLETLQGDLPADSPYAYRAVIDGVGFESRRSGGNTTLRTVDGDQPVGSAAWNASLAQVTMSLPVAELEDLGVHGPYEVYGESHIIDGAFNGLADDRAPDAAGFTSDDCFIDPTGDSLFPGGDIAEACIGGETIGSFQVLLHVDDLEQAAPTGADLLGINAGLITQYNTGWTFDESPSNPVRYQVQATNYLVTVDGSLEPDVGQEFVLNVQGETAADTLLTTQVAEIEGEWDEETGFITWTVPKAEMDVVTAPIAVGETLVRGSANTPSAADTLYDMDAQVRTWIYAGVGAGPGQTVWDTATGADTTYTFTGGNLPPEAVLEAEPTTGDAPLTVQFDITASSDPEGEAMDYHLDFGDGTSPAEGTFPPAGTIDHTYTEDGVFTATLTLSDASGAQATDEATIGVGALDVEHVRLTHNDGLVENIPVTTGPGESDTWSTTVDLTDAVGGTHEIKAEWYEADGTLLATDRVEVLIDTIAPFVEILDPGPGTEVTGEFQVEGTAGHRDPSAGEGAATTSQALQPDDEGLLDLLRSASYDFNGGTQGWTVVNEGPRDTPALADEDPSDTLGKWSRTPLRASGGQHWYIGSPETTTYTPGSLSNLVSPSIDLTSAEAGSLSFDLSGDVATGDQMRVQWKPAGAPDSTYQNLRAPINANHIDAGFNPVTQRYTVALPEPALGQEVEIRFRFEAQLDTDVLFQFPWGYFIDNVDIDTVSENVEVPGAPQNLSADPGVEKVTLSWEVPADDGGAAITGYDIHRDGDLLVGDHATQSYQDTDVTAGTEYTYTVSAVNAVGEGPQSAPATATPLEDDSGDEGQSFAITHPEDGAVDVPGDTRIEGDLRLDGDGGGGGTQPETHGRVVVASLDGGLNPYHDFFYETGSRPGGGSSPIYPAGEPPSAVTEEVLQELGIDEEHRVELTRTGNWGADRNADAALWNKIEQGRGDLWWFKGTNLIATNKGGSGAAILPTSPHGTAVAAAALAANPQQVHLSVKGNGAAAETWAFNQPFVDIVTTSYGPPGSVPIPFHLAGAYGGVVTGGKLHFGAAENLPVTTQQDTTAGPWWSIAIGGIEEGDSEGRQVQSGNFIDFLADFTQTLPNCTSCSIQMDPFTGGTSFATPRSAGVASAVLQEARERAGHQGGIDTTTGAPVMVKNPESGATITNWQIRRALEEAATYNGMADWDPVDGVFDFVTLPVVDVAPYVQSGWGILSPAVVPAAVEQLEGAGANKGADACEYMMVQMETRFAYWDVVNAFSESWLSGEHPYIRCDEDVLPSSAAFELTDTEACILQEGATPEAPPPYDILEVCLDDDGTWLHATFKMNLVLGDDDLAAPDSNIAWWDFAFRTDTDYILEANGDLIYGDGGTGYNADLWRFDPTGGTTGGGAWVPDGDARTKFEMDWLNDEFTVSVMLEDINAGPGDVVTDTWAATWPNAFLTYAVPYDTVPDGAGLEEETYGDDYVVGGEDTPPPEGSQVLVSLEGPEDFDALDNDTAVVDLQAGNWTFDPDGVLPAGAYTATARQEDDGQQVAAATITFTVGDGSPVPPPEITGVLVDNITQDRATVSWVTDRPATSRVDFGTTEFHGRVQQDLALKTEHELELSNLEPGTTYHFQVTSEDNEGRSNSTADDTFTTQQAPAETVDVFVAGDLIGTREVDTSQGEDAWGPVPVDSTLYPDGSLKIEAVFTDRDGQTATQMIEVIVENDPTEPPEFIAVPDQGVDEGGFLEFFVEATDPKYTEQDLEYSADALPEGAVFHAPQRRFSWSPDFEQAGGYEVSFNVTNPDGRWDVMEVNITVFDVNRAPRIPSGIQNHEINVKETLEFIIEAVDDDGDEIVSLTLGPLPEGATFETEPMDPEGSQVQGVFNWTPAIHQGGVYELTANATDIEGDSSQRSFLIDVDGVSAILIDPRDHRQLADNSTPVEYLVSAVDSSGHPVDVDDATDIVWSIDDAAGGSFQENVLTPGTAIGEYTIEAHVLGDPGVSDSTRFTVGAFKNTQTRELFADLQEAIDAAQSGQSVILIPGTYPGPLSVPAGTTDLTLCAADAARAGCAAEADPTQVVLEDDGIVVDAAGTQGFTLQGVTLSGDPVGHLELSDSQGAHVLDNRFEASTSARAIALSGADDLRVEGNTFTGAGIDGTGGSQIHILGNLFDQCQDLCVDLSSGDDAPLSDVQVKSNGFEVTESETGLSGALSIAGGSTVFVEENTYTGPGTGTDTYGVLLQGGSGLHVFNEVFTDVRHALAFDTDAAGDQPAGTPMVQFSSFEDTRYGLWLLSGTSGVHVDARDNEWGVNPLLVDLKIRDQGSGNSWQT